MKNRIISHYDNEGVLVEVMHFQGNVKVVVYGGIYRYTVVIMKGAKK